MSRAQTPSEPAGAPAEGGSRASSRASSRVSQRSKLGGEPEEAVAITGSRPPSRPKSAVSKQSKPSSPVNDENGAIGEPDKANRQTLQSPNANASKAGDGTARSRGSASPAPPSRPRSGASRPSSAAKVPLGDSATAATEQEQQPEQERHEDRAQEQAQEGRRDSRRASATQSRQGASKPGSAASIRIPSAAANRADDQVSKPAAATDEAAAAAAAAARVDEQALDGGEGARAPSRPKSSKRGSGSASASSSASRRRAQESELASTVVPGAPEPTAVVTEARTGDFAGTQYEDEEEDEGQGAEGVRPTLAEREQTDSGNGAFRFGQTGDDGDLYDADAYARANGDGGPDDGDDNGLGNGQDDSERQAGNENENEADNEGELLVLDPDHPLMQRFQARLKEHLSKHLERKTQQLRELAEATKRKRREREDLGVELLGVQQDLAKQQMQVEQTQEALAGTRKARADTDWRLTDVRSQYRDWQTQVNEQLRQTGELQTEVENLALKVHFLKGAQRDVGGDVALMKRVVEKAQRDKLKAEQDKQEQDVVVDRLVEQIDRRREQLAMYEAQLVAQAEETRAATLAASEARGEIESIEVEKKQLYQHWNSSLVGMRRRDEAYSAMQEALNQQHQAIQSLEMEVEGFKRSISSEQEQNEKLMLILKKTEQDAATSRKLLQQTEQRYEQLKQEYSARSRMLHETEQQLQRVQSEKGVKAQEIDALRKQIEREYVEKVRLEDEILETIRSRLTLVKASQYTDKVTAKIRDRTKELESQLVEAENDIAQHVLETANVRSGVDKLQQIVRGLLGEIDKKNQLIGRSEVEMSKRVIAIGRKQDQVDQLQKKLQAMIATTGGEELGPLEVQINQLSKTIQTTLEHIGELQQVWLRDQQELVHLTRQSESEEHVFDISKKEYVILIQKKLRVENRIDVERAEIREVSKSIAHLRNEMEKLNALLFKERGQKQGLEQDNSLMETDFVLRLRELEKESLVLTEHVDTIRREKQKFVEELIEAERQIMEWEKKTQLAVETKKAVDTEIGAGEVSAMKNEIHRMEVRFAQLTRQQEQLIQEMEKSVSRRDTIFTRGEALQQSKHKSVTKGQIERKLADMRRQVKFTIQEANRVDQETEAFKAQQQALIEQLEERRANCKSLQRSIDDLDAELSQLQEQREKLMSEVLILQRRAKYLQQVKEGKYVRVCRSSGALDTELQKQIDRLHGLCLAIDRINQEQPQFQAQLRNVSVLLNARAASADAQI